METTAYIALSRQMALRQRMDVIANNVANMTSTGFKAEEVLLEPVLARAGGGRRLAFVQDVATVRDTAPGPMTPTGNPLDLAIDGPGYFVVDGEDGPRYTRSGQFRVDEVGDLVTVAGDPVLDDAGGPIAIPPDARRISVADDGTISTEAGVIGRIDVVTFADEQALRKAGSGLYESDEVGEPAAGARVVQGMLEGSNVTPVLEMTEMMAIQRAYQGTQRLLESHHESQRRAIERMLDVSQ